MESNGRSNNFTSDFENVSPYLDENGLPPAHYSGRGSAGGGQQQTTPRHASANANSNNNAAAAGAQAMGGGPVTDLAALSSDMLRVPEGPIGVGHVNWLLSACGITQERSIDSLRQCSSSLFALLFQRIFNCTIQSLELEPNTREKRLWNIERVMDELQLFVSTDLSYISADRIVALDEHHISELIRVFFEIVIGFVAASAQQQQQLASGGGGAGQHQQGVSGGGGPIALGAHSSALREGALLQDDDQSQADSAHKTQRLVSNWKRGVVHPLRDVGARDGASSALSGSTAARRGANRRAASASAASGSPNENGGGKVGSGLPSDSMDLRSRINRLDHLLVTPERRHLMRGGPRGGQGGYAGPTARTANAGGAGVAFGGAGPAVAVGGEVGVAAMALKKRRGASASTPSPTGAVTSRSVMAAGGKRRGNSAAKDSLTATKRGGAPQHHDPLAPAGLAGASARTARSRSAAAPLITATTDYADKSDAALTSALFPPSTYGLVRTINTEARDIKIEQLKTLRLISGVQQQMRASIVNSASEAQRAIAGSVRAQQARVRADTRDMMRYARDENERYKKAYEAILMSARNDVAAFRDIVDPKTVQIYDRNQRATRAAAAGVEAAIRLQREVEDRRAERYYDAITLWRRGTVACV